MNKKTADVIIIGAGPAGVSAAITIARGGKKVLILERGDNAGDKNMFGGCIYECQTEDIFPGFKESGITERRADINKIFLLTDKASTEIAAKEEKEKNAAYTVIRSKWDRYCIERAVEEGVYYAPKTLVKHLIKEHGVVVGVETEKEKLYSDIVIVADGVNSLLAKEAGLRNEFTDKDMTINVKEVIRLPKEKIEDRFGLDAKNGFTARIFGGPLKNTFSMGFIYTNKESVSIGVGIALDELKKIKKKPYELLEELKAHPSIAPYIKGGELVEYSAHLIPEGSFDSIPKVYDNRIMIAGDAAGFVNNLHLEGTNLAMLSGKLTGETALFALEKGDCSASVLSEYYKKLEKSIIIKDLKTHNDTIKVMKKNISTISSLYPETMLEFLNILSTADNIPKKKKYTDFVKNVIKSGCIQKSLPLGIFALGKLRK